MIQTGEAYISGWPFPGGNSLIEGNISGWYAPLRVITSVPEFNFANTGAFDMPIFRCSNGESRSTAYSNHQHHEVIDPTYTYAVPPDNWDEVLDMAIANQYSGQYALFNDQLLSSPFTEQRGNNVSGARVEILNSLGISTTNSNFIYSREVPFPTARS